MGGGCHCRDQHQKEPFVKMFVSLTLGLCEFSLIKNIKRGNRNHPEFGPEVFIRALTIICTRYIDLSLYICISLGRNMYLGGVKAAC